MQIPQFPDLGALDAALAAPTFLVFKHSPICPASDRGFAEYERFVAAHPGVPTAWIDVIGERSFARHVAEATGVRHESPQALLVRDGRVAWHADHGAITVRSLEEALRGAA